MRALCNAAFALLVTLLVTTRVAPAAAQELLVDPAPRQGYFVGAGVMAARVESVLQSESLRPFNSALGNIRLGQMATPWLGLGLELNYSQVANEAWTGSFGGLLLDVQFVPFDHLGLHVGAGAGAISLIRNAAADEPAEGTGGAYYATAVSYDWFPLDDGQTSGGFSVTPKFQILFLPGDDFHSLSYLLGIEILWWSGLPNEMLNLSHQQAYSPVEPKSDVSHKEI